MTKTHLRAALRLKRDAFVASLDAVGARLAFSHPPHPLRDWIAEARTVAAYAPIGSEANPLALLAFAEHQGRATALPHVVSRPVPLRFLAWKEDDELVDGPFGLSQPDRGSDELEPDLILAPLLAFDRRLHRLGQGAGHYDRAFARFPDARRVGVAWSAQEIEIVPDDPWDVPLDAVLTEREWIVRDRDDA